MSGISLKNRLIEMIEDYLYKRGFDFEYDEGHACFMVRIPLHHSTLNCACISIFCRDKDMILRLLLNTGKCIDAKNMKHIMEAANFINEIIFEGHFQIDLDHNKIEYVKYILCEHVPFKDITDFDFEIEQIKKIVEKDGFGADLLNAIYGI